MGVFDRFKRLSDKECEDRLKDRYADYLADSDAGADAAADKLGAGLLDAAKGFIAGLVSSLVAGAIDDLLEKTGARDLVTKMYSALAILMTIGPQLYLALFKICTDVIKNQAEQRIAVAEEVRDLTDLILVVVEQLLLFPSIKGTFSEKLNQAAQKVNSADKNIGRVTSIGAVTGQFPSNVYSQAIDDIGSAVSYLTGGDGTPRHQDDPPDHGPYGDEDIEDVLLIEGGERESERIRLLWKKIQKYTRMASVAFLGIVYRTVSITAIIKAFRKQINKIDPQTTSSSWSDLFIKNRLISIESDSAGLSGLSTSIGASIKGIEALDKFVTGSGNWNKSLDTLKMSIITNLLGQKAFLKDMYEEMTVIIEKNDLSEAMIQSPGWVTKLEGLWQWGQAGGPQGAVMDDLATLQEEMESYQELKDYLSQDTDWTRGYAALDILIGKTGVQFVKAILQPNNPKKIRDLYGTLVRIREITHFGILEDQELVAKINAFKGDSPLVREAENFLKNMQGGLGGALASGDAAKFMGEIAAYSGLAGSAFALIEELQDASCSTRPSPLGSVHTETGQTAATKANTDMANNELDKVKISFEGDDPSDTGLKMDLATQRAKDNANVIGEGNARNAIKESMELQFT